MVLEDDIPSQYVILRQEVCTITEEEKEECSCGTGPYKCLPDYIYCAIYIHQPIIYI